MKLYTITVLLIQLGCGAFAQSSKPLFPQKPGVVSYTYRKYFEKDAAAALDTIKSKGFKDIEFSNLFGKTPDELRGMMDERGLHCSSFGVSYDDLIHKTKEVATNAQKLGAQYVRVAWIPHTGAFSLADAQKAVADFNRVGKTLHDQYHLGFLYHEHGYEFEPYENGTLYDYIVQQTIPRYVSFELDILWAFFPGQDPVKLIEKYGSRYKAIHLKDLRKGVTGNLTGAGPSSNDVALGEGQINIPAILKAAQQSAIQHFYIEDESDQIITQVPQSITYLKSLKNNQ